MQIRQHNKEDKNTFALTFYGKTDTDEQGDEYHYLCEYWKDNDTWHFLKVWDDDNAKAEWTEQQISEIKAYMQKLMDEAKENTTKEN